jgi:hypothetical protein
VQGIEALLPPDDHIEVGQLALDGGLEFVQGTHVFLLIVLRAAAASDVSAVAGRARMKLDSAFKEKTPPSTLMAQ